MIGESDLIVRRDGKNTIVSVLIKDYLGVTLCDPEGLFYHDDRVSDLVVWAYNLGYEEGSRK